MAWGAARDGGNINIPTGGRPEGRNSRGRDFPRTGILPGIFDARRRQGMAWERHMMGETCLFPRLQHPGAS